MSSAMYSVKQVSFVYLVKVSFPKCLVVKPPKYLLYMFDRLLEVFFYGNGKCSTVVSEPKSKGSWRNMERCYKKISRNYF